MQQAADFRMTPLPARLADRARPAAKYFAAALLVCACASALFATWLPLPVSIVTVFLFAGPHNLFELRYFLSRLPVRLGRSRNFFLTAFLGVGLLTAGYISLPVVYSLWPAAAEAWPSALATWNTGLLLWIGLLVWLRGRQKLGRDWSLAIPIVLALSGFNWLAPQFFSLALVYLHPLLALWFLDRQLRRRRPDWLPIYHRFVCLLPVILAVMILRLAATTPLADDNGLFWRITQHAGAELLPGVSSHLLVSVHVFLEMLHYGVWLIALPLIGTTGAVWSTKSVPLARHPRGFPRLVATLLLLGLFFVIILWLGFSVNYSTTRDIYFTVAIAHVLAEAPFLLRML